MGKTLRRMLNSADASHQRANITERARTGYSRDPKTGAVRWVGGPSQAFENYFEDKFDRFHGVMQNVGYGLDGIGDAVKIYATMKLIEAVVNRQQSRQQTQLQIQQETEAMNKLRQRASLKFNPIGFGSKEGSYRVSDVAEAIYDGHNKGAFVTKVAKDMYKEAGKTDATRQDIIDSIGVDPKLMGSREYVNYKQAAANHRMHYDSTLAEKGFAMSDCKFFDAATGKEIDPFKEIKAIEVSGDNRLKAASELNAKANLIEDAMIHQLDMGNVKMFTPDGKEFEPPKDYYNRHLDKMHMCEQKYMKADALESTGLASEYMNMTDLQKFELRSKVAERYNLSPNEAEAFVADMEATTAVNAKVDVLKIREAQQSNDHMYDRMYEEMGGTPINRTRMYEFTASKADKEDIIVNEDFIEDKSAPKSETANKAAQKVMNKAASMEDSEPVIDAEFTELN